MKEQSTTARLEARIPADLHELLKQVAKMQGRTVSDFVVVAIRAAAQQALMENCILELTAADQLRFAEALLSPPPQTPAMQEALALHASLVERR